MKINFFLLIFCISIFACGKDEESAKCDQVECGDFGTCDETNGDCICEQYYEGELCGDEVRSRYTGQWTGYGTCNYNPTVNFDLIIDVTSGLNVSDIKIQSAQILQEFTMSGSLDDDNKIVIPEFMSHISSNVYDGVMSVENDTLQIRLNYYIENGGTGYCDYFLTK